MKNEDFIEHLAKNFPEIMEKSGDFEFSINEGWHNIVESLFILMSHDVNQAKSMLKFAVENPGNEHTSPVDKLEKKLAEKLAELPFIEQVKEKFGSLRFYVAGSTQATDNYIEFAELMSGRTCEMCGAPGERRTGSWIHTLCDLHAQKDKDEHQTPQEGKIPPNLFDE